MNQGTVYLIPTVIAEEKTGSIPSETLQAIGQCQVFFAENLRTSRRYLKRLFPSMIIDNYQWFDIGRAEVERVREFLDALASGATVGILSEAGCPGVADPGQALIAAAQEGGYRVVPLTGPSSILLALMASGLNGQRFSFQGYLPIEAQERQQAIRQLEQVSEKNHSTQIFIETPYRNNQVLETLLKTLKPTTRLCIAADIHADQEKIITRTVASWKKTMPELHKKQVIFLFLAG